MLMAGTDSIYPEPSLLTVLLLKINCWDKVWLLHIQLALKQLQNVKSSINMFAVITKS